MANKPASRNWNDIQIAIAVMSMTFTLIFWNVFAGPDRELALKRAQEQAARDQAERERIAQEQAIQAQTAPQPQAIPSAIIEPAAPQMTGPILFGGSAPQTVIVQSGGGGGGGRGGGGGGGGGGTGGS